MYTDDNPTLFVRIRRWWKSYRNQIRWDGYIKPLFEDFFPGYNKLNRLYWAIRHRTTDVFHKIDTGLTPGYYDADSRMVHGMFSLLCEYIDEKGGVAKCEEEIVNLGNNWGEGYDDIPEEQRQGHIDAANLQANEVRKAIDLYNWWMITYPMYNDYDNNPWSKYCDSKRKEDDQPIMNRMFNSRPCAFDADGDPTMFLLNRDETPEEEANSRIALDASTEYENNKETDITEKLIELIKLRGRLWV